MKRLIAMSIGLLTLAGAASAQSGTNLDPSFGVRLSWDLNTPSTNLDGVGSGSGFSVGGFYNIPLTNKIYFEPGLSFFYNTMSDEVLNMDDINHPYSVDATFRNTGFRMPLNFGYRFNLVEGIGLSVYTGAQLNYGLSMKMHCKGSPDEKMYGNNWTRWDAQWLFGVRFHYQDNWIAEIGGGVALNNLFTGDLAKQHHLRRNIVNIGVGYIF